MWFDGERQPNTMYVANVSRGKDSTAMLRAIRLMGWPLDAVVAVDIWATQDIPAELPPMVEFKEEWDKKCLENFGIPVTRICATCESAVTGQSAKLTYEDFIYRKLPDKRWRDRERKMRIKNPNGDFTIHGFPLQTEPECQAALKRSQLTDTKVRTATANLRIPFSTDRRGKAQKINIVHYIGIAADEPERVARHMPKNDMIMPLVQIGWDEALCGLEATFLDMLSPTYTTSMRDGCWFCHNQGVGQLRNLRHNYPDLWALLMKWDTDSPVTFHADGHTVHDFDRRFQLEDEGLIRPDERFRWSMLEETQLRFF